MDRLAKGADIISLFCRINIHTRHDLPVRSSEMGLLMFITHSAQPPTSADAVTFFKVSKPMVAGMVRSLESKGYLARGKSASANRRFTLLLTEKGKTLVTQTTEEYFKNMTVLLEGLGRQDFDTLLALLDRANTLLLNAEKNKSDDTQQREER